MEGLLYLCGTNNKTLYFMELKYSSKDVCKLVDIFYNLSREIKDNDKLAVEIEKLTQYPINVINEFLICVSNLTETQIKEKYMGVVGYITMRLNFPNFSNVS